MIGTATNTVVGAPIAVGTTPYGVSVTPDGSRVYIANSGSNTVSMITRSTNTVQGTIAVGIGATAIGAFITPDPASIPTLSEWAMIGFATLLLGAAMWRIRGAQRRLADARRR